MKNWKLAALLNTPLGLVIVLGSLVLTVELLIMEIIHDVLVPMIFPEVYWGFIDTVLLTIIVSPALYFLVFRKMHENEGRFRLINASAQDAIIVVNEQCLITEWNLAAQKMFQLDAPKKKNPSIMEGFGLMLPTASFLAGIPAENRR